jgi:putative transposase
MEIEAAPGVKYSIIQAMTLRDDNMLNISWLCEIAGVSRSGYYSWLASAEGRQRREKRDRLDFDLVLTAYLFRGYDKGGRGIYMRFLHMKPPVNMNVKKIRRLMQKYGLKCPVRKANPYRRMAKAMETSYVAPNLLNREFRQHGPRKVLLTDITYLLYGDGKKCYMSTIIDAFTSSCSPGRAANPCRWTLCLRRSTIWSAIMEYRFRRKRSSTATRALTTRA